MNPLVISLLKNIAIKAVMKKVEKEVVKIKRNSDDTVTGTVGVIEEAIAVDKKKVSGWITVGLALLLFASSQGYVSPELYKLVETILTTPEVVEQIEYIAE